MCNCGGNTNVVYHTPNNYEHKKHHSKHHKKHKKHHHKHKKYEEKTWYKNDCRTCRLPQGRYYKNVFFTSSTITQKPFYPIDLLSRLR